MFTGIIEEIGRIRTIARGPQSIRLTISCSKVLTDSHPGDSIAVNGICLTAAALGSDWFSADVMPETLRRTNLHQLKLHDPVNLERALRLSDRLGGHMVSGHIDGTGRVVRLVREDNAIRLTFETTPAILRYVVSKGSVSIDGVSLTVAGVDEETLQVSLIPHTAGQTTLGGRKIGDDVNIECDVIGKYVEKMLGGHPDLHSPNPDAKQTSGLTLDFLRANGFG